MPASLQQLLRDRPALLGYIVIRAADELGAQMLNVAIGWYLYSATHSPMSLAYVGLSQFLASLATLPLGGQAADLFDKRKVIGIALGLQTLCLGLFAAWTFVASPLAWLVYALLIVVGAARSFYSPAMSAMLPRIVSVEDFPRAVAVSTSAFQVCAIAGPALGGVVYAVSGPAAFTAAAALSLLATFAARGLPPSPASATLRRDVTVTPASAAAANIGVAPASAVAAETSADRGILAGIRYVWATRLLFALISLDLFAVLLGGVTTLLPIYAKDILNVGPRGLGCLVCAPGAGAALVGLVLAHGAIAKNAGKQMLACVAGFGIATVVFALSRSFWLSLAALAVAGGFDMVSMVIRQTLVQISTPDAMRGRVSAVNSVFIGASNELGGFESGATAALFGTVPAAVLGGAGTLLVVALWAAIFPELRRPELRRPELRRP